MAAHTRRMFAALSLAGIIAGFVAGPAMAQDEIVLGATVPLTGPLVVTGQQYHYALQMAQDDINAAGGINGKKLRIVFEDTQASNSVAVNAFIKLLRQHNPPFIFLSSYTIQNLAAEPEVAKAKIPVMYAGGADAIHERKNPWMFRIRPADSLQSKAMTDVLLTYYKAKKVGIMYVQDDYGQGAANYLESELKKNGVEVVGKEAFGPRDNDFSAQLLSLKNKSPDTLAVIPYIRDGAMIMQQRRNLGITTRVVAPSPTVLPSTLDLITPADLDGIVSTTDAFLGEAVSPMSADFVRRFQARFNLRPDPYGSSYYDGALIVAEAIRKVGMDREKIREYLANVKDFKGVTRTYRTDENNNMAHSLAFVTFKPGTKDFELKGMYPRETK